MGMEIDKKEELRKQLHSLLDLMLDRGYLEGTVSYYYPGNLHLENNTPLLEKSLVEAKIMLELNSSLQDTVL